MNFEPRLHSRKVSERDFLTVVGIMSLFAARKLKASGQVLFPSAIAVDEVLHRTRKPRAFSVIHGKTLQLWLTAVFIQP